MSSNSGAYAFNGKWIPAIVAPIAVIVVGVLVSLVVFAYKHKKAQPSTYRLRYERPPSVWERASWMVQSNKAPTHKTVLEQLRLKTRSNDTKETTGGNGELGPVRDSTATATTTTTTTTPRAPAGDTQRKQVHRLQSWVPQDTERLGERYRKDLGGGTASVSLPVLSSALMTRFTDGAARQGAPQHEKVPKPAPAVVKGSPPPPAAATAAAAPLQQYPDKLSTEAAAANRLLALAKKKSAPRQTVHDGGSVYSHHASIVDPDVTIRSSRHSMSYTPMGGRNSTNPRSSSLSSVRSALSKLSGESKLSDRSMQRIQEHTERGTKQLQRGNHRVPHLSLLVPAAPMPQRPQSSPCGSSLSFASSMSLPLAKTWFDKPLPSMPDGTPRGGETPPEELGESSPETPFTPPRTPSPCEKPLKTHRPSKDGAVTPKNQMTAAMFDTPSTGDTMFTAHTKLDDSDDYDYDEGNDGDNVSAYSFLDVLRRPFLDTPSPPTESKPLPPPRSPNHRLSITSAAASPPILPPIVQPFPRLPQLNFSVSSLDVVHERPDLYMDERDRIQTQTPSPLSNATLLSMGLTGPLDSLADPAPLHVKKSTSPSWHEEYSFNINTPPHTSPPLSPPSSSSIPQRSPSHRLSEPPPSRPSCSNSRQRPQSIQSVSPVLEHGLNTPREGRPAATGPADCTAALKPALLLATPPSNKTDEMNVLVLCRAIHTYMPAMEDEMAVRSGQWVMVHRIFNDGWCYARLLDDEARHGYNYDYDYDCEDDDDYVDSGIVPGSCLAVIDPDDASVLRPLLSMKR